MRKCIQLDIQDHIPIYAFVKQIKQGEHLFQKWNKSKHMFQNLELFQRKCFEISQSLTGIVCLLLITIIFGIAIVVFITKMIFKKQVSKDKQLISTTPMMSNETFQTSIISDFHE